MSTLQVRIDDTLKAQAESLFNSLGLDTSTAIRIFLNSAVENNGIPFAVQHRSLSPSLTEAIRDTRTRTNLHGPYATAQEAIDSMLEDE
jgi:DNA-damage-inducible protein J